MLQESGDSFAGRWRDRTCVCEVDKAFDGLLTKIDHRTGLWSKD